MRTIALAVFALLMFAANSLLCRYALAGDRIGPALFTAIRLATAAALLSVLAYRGKGSQWLGGDMISAFWLVLYAVPFAYAYVGLTTGTGALLLFGAVQLSMMTVLLVRGQRPGLLWYAGCLIACTGLVVLLRPGLASPPLLHALGMAVAGIAWGFYTLRGRIPGDAIARTTGNFVRGLPLVAVVVAVALLLSDEHASPEGIAAALFSGAIASALGYVVWYKVLAWIPGPAASSIQLSVPVLATLGGTALLAEPFTGRLALSSALVLGGIGLTLWGAQRQAPRTREGSNR